METFSSATRILEVAYSGLERNDSVSGGVRVNLWDSPTFEQMLGELEAPFIVFWVEYMETRAV